MAMSCKIYSHTWLTYQNQDCIWYKWFSQWFLTDGTILEGKIRKQESKTDPGINLNIVNWITFGLNLLTRSHSCFRVLNLLNNPVKFCKQEIAQRSTYRLFGFNISFSSVPTYNFKLPIEMASFENYLPTNQMLHSHYIMHEYAYNPQHAIWTHMLALLEKIIL